MGGPRTGEVGLGGLRVEATSGGGGAPAGVRGVSRVSILGLLDNRWEHLPGMMEDG